MQKSNKTQEASPTTGGNTASINIEHRVAVAQPNQRTRSGFRGTTNVTKDGDTPSRRLQDEISKGVKPHPLMILPKRGGFWCDPPNVQMRDEEESAPLRQRYFLSCYEMNKPWQNTYDVTENVVVNPTELAAEAYVNNFSKVILKLHQFM